MKIICVGRNYGKHAKELGNPIPEKPVLFLKPDSAILRNNKPFFYPHFTKNLHYEVEVLVRTCKVGKNIAEKFASRYIGEVGLGIDFTARDLQEECKNAGLPWEISKSFDNSAAVSEFFPVTDYKSIGELNFRLDVNGKTVQNGNTRDLIFSFEKIIAYASQFMTIKTGDIIFSGTPEGVGPLQINDHLEGYLEDKKLLDFYIK
ncbi:MAG: 2-hydroxyhepta-2,4-diene-1,7-dioate isomerase [Bacteroidetes bacterium HGW-Bacteroidetes-21]|jgi:2-keto-4-pentenoate hydratase/2-oxohepta-3-ene-1,7-dioic acid hydratase in catechol pathway|nr:MAG: 2-hydroxyhepta-2,4-diene-1,7-dioate isomerase [Bacteroidetes bacterium HGW-Bacteroidetes-21]